MKSFIKILFFNLFFASTIIAQDDEFGIASYYSDLFQGKPTASGELYNKSKLTAAHKTLPFGTLVKVTRLDNNASVQVRVNDRGPFISGRIIELSREAATRIDLIQDGATRVKVEIVNEKPDPGAIASSAAVERPKSFEETDKRIVKKEVPKPAAKKQDPASAKKSKAKVNKKPSKASAPIKTNAKPSKSVLVKSQDYTELGLYEIELRRPEKKGFGVQVAALTNQNALFKKIADLQGAWFTNILVNVEKNKGGDLVYKILLGPYNTQSEAENYKSNLKKNKKISGFVVDLSAIDK